MSKRAIGVFDSGLGGISVLKVLKDYLPNEKFIYIGDSKYAPYGEKSEDEVISRCIEIAEELIKKNVKAIVIACNTATSVAVKTLRDRYKDLIIIGIEPAIKYALSKASNKSVVVMATPITIKAKNLNDLINEYKGDNKVIKIACPELVRIVENGELDNKDKVIGQLNKYFKDIDLKSVSSVVLGCTHFPFFKEYLNEILGDNVELIDGSLGVSKQLKRKLIENNLIMSESADDEKIVLLNTLDDDSILEKTKNLLFN